MMTPLFLSLTAHGSMIFCAIYEKAEYIYASLPPEQELKREFEDLDASIT
uniref:Uncharacterized protein n=1 Tax=Panagrolaimus sp. JU765 TaxID=591449 RepID=A0AC34RAA5_9BILA